MLSVTPGPVTGLQNTKVKSRGVITDKAALEPPSKFQLGLTNNHLLAEFPNTVSKQSFGGYLILNFLAAALAKQLVCFSLFTSRYIYSHIVLWYSAFLE